MTQKRILLTLLFVLLFTLLLALIAQSAHLASAASPEIIISELYPAPPAGSGEPEWIELANVSEQDIDISGWEVWDQLASPGQLNTFEPGTMVPANSFLLIELTVHKLNNTGDGVVLIHSDGTIVDDFWYSGTTASKSWQRQSADTTQRILTNPTPSAEHPEYPVLSASTTQPSPSPQPSPTPTPSPASTPQPTSTPTPQPTLDPTTITQHVTFTEFAACPSGGSEWIELYNTSPQLTITDWVVRDAGGNQRTISGELPPFTFTRFSWGGSLLNNSGDEFSIFTDTDALIGSASYDSCTLGLSHIWDGTNWIQLALDLTTNPTPTPTPSPSPTTQPAPTTEPDSTKNETEQAGSATEANAAIQGATTTTTEPYPHTLPTYSPQQLHTGATITDSVIEFEQSELPKLPTLSVIMGGLLQLLPGAVSLYVKRTQSSDIS
ncbi:MAG: lamin tail domain-containing protein [Patescibacteria group bacterium]